MQPQSGVTCSHTPNHSVAFTVTPILAKPTQRRWSQNQIQLSEKHGAVRSRVEERQLFLEAGSIGDEFTRHKVRVVFPLSKPRNRRPQFKVCASCCHLVDWELLHINHHEDRNSLCLIRRSIGVCISSAQVCGVRSHIFFWYPKRCTAGEMDARRWMKIEVVRCAIKVDISFIDTEMCT